MAKFKRFDPRNKKANLQKNKSKEKDFRIKKVNSSKKTGSKMAYLED